MPTKGHELIERLPLTEIWTTNYDPLLERSVPAARTIVREDDLAERRIPGERRIVKMHGSYLIEPAAAWQEPPTITRSHYERYPETHPRIWAALQAAFLTRSFLFLGFSFSDPNIEVLLRLSRTRLHHQGAQAFEHFAVMRRDQESPEQRSLYQHRLQDLNRSGIGVIEVADFGELLPLLERLFRWTRPPRLFVSGSTPPSGADIEPMCRMLGHRLAASQRPFDLVSMAGPAGMSVSFAFGRELRSLGCYAPERVTFRFRRKEGPAPELLERIGVVVHTDEEEDDLRRRLINDCRALLAIGGGTRTEKGIARQRWARRHASLRRPCSLDDVTGRG